MNLQIGQTVYIANTPVIVDAVDVDSISGKDENGVVYSHFSFNKIRTAEEKERQESCNIQSREATKNKNFALHYGTHSAKRRPRNEQRVPTSFLEYVVANWTEITANIPEEQEGRFQNLWLAYVGSICDQPYTVSLNPKRWGLSTRIDFPTPPSSVVIGDANVFVNTNRKGFSFICQNDFFWEVVAIVKQLGPRLS